MTSITFKLDKDNFYKGFICEGHAGYADAGEDIVCAGISTLTFTFINSVDELLDMEIVVDADSDNGFMDVSVTDYKDSSVQLLFRSMVLGLKSIEDDYSKYLKLTNRREKP